MRDIGKNIRDLRVKRGLTQDQLAEQLFVTRQTVSNYETGKSRPDIDMLEKLAQVLGTDLQQMIYGPEKRQMTPEIRHLIAGCGACLGIVLLQMILQPIAQALKQSYWSGLSMVIIGLLQPVLYLCWGWTLLHLLGMALKWKPARRKWVRCVGACMLVMLVAWLVLSVWYLGANVLNEWLCANHLRGEWREPGPDDVGVLGSIWSMLPTPVPLWLNICYGWIIQFTVKYPWIYALWGGALWLCGLPKGRVRLKG